MTQSQMHYRATDRENLTTEVRISSFQGQDGVNEYHLIVCPTEDGNVLTQLEWIDRAYRDALTSLGLSADTAVLRRVFCSDLPNQALIIAPCLADIAASCALSVVNQPPAPPAKIALWAYHVDVHGETLEKHKDGATLSLRRGELTHCWTTGLSCLDADTSYGQTAGIFATYEECLQARGLRLADHVLRSWLFVRDVDANYQGVVAARREFFTERGLTPETHYIASTGIEGTSANVTAKVMMDAYAIAGVRQDQIRYLAAPDYLCPTHLYGVTFERGVAVAYQDRKQIMISGTASIDHTGSILHPGDVVRQLDRTLENVAALLQQADATLADVGMFIVYVRNIGDLDLIQRLMTERCDGAPMLVVKAPVCRPGWLVEVECMATIPADNPGMPAF